MVVNRIAALCFVMFTSVVFITASAQTDTSIAAGAGYIKPSFYKFLWGEHFRREWVQPVRVPYFLLDTANGGLRVTKMGGGKQSFSLHLKTKNNREYALRSVDKEFARTAPDIIKGTFVEDLVADLTSLSHPYGATTIPPLARAANVYYSENKNVFVPKQPLLDSFNAMFGNKMYLFEQRPDDDWSDAPNFGYSKKIIDTEALHKKLLKSNKNRVDGRMYVRSRLFDMFLGDWDRHEGQWRWAKTKENNVNIYQPIPKDRDMVYTSFDGILLKVAIKGAGLFYLQDFKDDIKNIKTFNYESRNSDRWLGNEVPLRIWKEEADFLMQHLTDTIIDYAMKQMPAEVQDYSAAEIAEKLKKRRSHLSQWAEEYYRFIAKEIDITGSEQKEHFVVNVEGDSTRIQIFSDGNGKPYYSRRFYTSETKEVRLYGIGGGDVFTIRGSSEDPIRIRIMGSTGSDSILNESTTNKSFLFVYDRPGTFVNRSENVRTKFSSDSTINTFNYNLFQYNKRGFSPVLFYSNADGVYAGIRYTLLFHRWRKQPFASKHIFTYNYSFTQQAPSVWYKGRFTEAVGRWDLIAEANYDEIYRANFFGFGNETTFDSSKLFYRTYRHEWKIASGLEQTFAKKHRVQLQFFLEGKELLKGINYLDKASGSDIYSPNTFGGAQLGYDFFNIDNKIVPTRGLAFGGKASFTQATNLSDYSFGRFDAYFKSYIPLTRHFVLSIRGGASTITDDAAIYHYPWIGGYNILRGYRRERFYGKTSVYNNNDISWQTNFRSRLVNGKLGILLLFDQGRVWMPNEVSNSWHNAYGLGLSLAPFNLFSATISYAVSPDGGIVQIGLSKDL